MDNLKFISDQMDTIAVPYEFGEWSSAVTYPYFVGEITEDSPLTEDGAEDSTLTLIGFMRGGTLLDLIEAKEKIKAHFHPIYGCRGDTNSGAIAVFYDGFFPVPSGEAGLHKIEIRLKIKEWKVK